MLAIPIPNNYLVPDESGSSGWVAVVVIHGGVLPMISGSLVETRGVVGVAGVFRGLVLRRRKLRLLVGLVWRVGSRQNWQIWSLGSKNLQTRLRSKTFRPVDLFVWRPTLTRHTTLCDVIDNSYRSKNILTSSKEKQLWFQKHKCRLLETEKKKSKS